MSDALSVTPPPPPPPSPAAASYDFLKPLTFVFEDPRWLNKVLLGGLFFLLGFLLIGFFFIMGYVARLTRNVIAGMQYPLPEWDDLGEYLGEGLKLFGIAFLYMLPIIVIAIGFGVPAAIMSAAQNEGVSNIGGGMLGCGWCLVMPLGFVVTFFLPAGLLMAVVERRFGAAFEFGRIWQFIKDNIGNYLLAIVIYFIARFAAGLGIMLLCIGIIFTEFWAMAVTGYAFAQVYKLARR